MQAPLTESAPARPSSNGRRTITVGVTGLNAIDSPGPGVPVIRALRDSARFDVRIIGLAYESLEPGAYMPDLVDRTYQIPLPGAGQASVLQRLAYIHQQEKLDVIIPNFDAELYNFIKLGPKLLEMGIHTFLPTLEQFEMRSKYNLNEFGEQNGILVPKSLVINKIHELPAMHEDFQFPYIVKGKFYEAYVAYNIEQAQQYFNKLAGKWGLPIIVQQFVYGTEVNVTAIGDGTGRTVGAVPMRKLYITDKGKAWSGVTLDDPGLIEATEKVIAATHWRGGLEMEMIKTNDDQYYLIEINPRFPAWVYLAVGAGQNHPEALVRMALGEHVEPFDRYDVGKLFIRYSFDLIRDLADFEQISVTGEL